MVIKNKTILNGQEVFNSLLKASKKSYISKFIFSAFILVIGTVIVSIAIPMKQTDSITIGVMFLMVGFMYFLMNIISFFRLDKKIRKNSNAVVTSGMTNEFTFKEESFQLTTRIDNQTARFENKYDELHKIIEYDDEIIFMLTKTDLFICKKSGFSSPKEMDVFFYGLAKHKTKIKKKLTPEPSEK